MIGNNLINAANTSSYGQYQAPPNYMWGTGDGFHGQLDSDITALSPTQVGTLTDWSVLSTNDNASYAIKTNGTLWSWGDNGNGQLGLNISLGEVRSSPVQVGTLTDWQDMAVGCQGLHQLAIKNNQTLWAWGSGPGGALGDGTTVSKSSPIQIGTLTDWVQITRGSSFSMAVKTNGTLWGWGLNTTGQIGDNTGVSKSSPIQIGTDTNWTYVVGGGSHTVALKTDGTIWSWGWNNNGQLGLGDRTNRLSPVQIGTLTNWSKVVCGFNWTVALKTDGTIWSWGSNGSGTLGDSTLSSKSSPIQIGTLTNWSNIFGGNQFVFATRTNGTVWAWGDNQRGAYGDGRTISRSSPVQVGNLVDFESLSGGNQHIIGKKTNGTLWSWSGNSDIATIGSGIMAAVGRTILYSSPIQVTNISNISMVSHELTVVHAIKKDGTLWAWGLGPNGEMGDTSLIGKASPVQIGTATDWSRISSGINHTVAIKTGGTLWAWGSDDLGQLGTGDTTPVSSPVQIGTLTGWSDISCGSLYTMAVRTNGTLWVWGQNVAGKLGDGSIAVSKSSPVQIGTLTDWAKAFAGASHSMAIKTDGTLWAWGLGNRGQLGNLSSVNRSSPIQVGTFTDWVDVHIGFSSSIAVRSNGTIWSWGATLNGISGRGSGAFEVSSPVQIGTLTNWKNIYGSAGGHTAIAVKTDGTIWTWGLNARGQLGLGDRTTRSSPVQVGTLTGWVSGSSGQFSSLFLTS